MADDLTIGELLSEYDRALSYTGTLWDDLTADELHWRPNVQSSAIGWHLGHQAAVAHFMIRNLTAAEPSPNPALEAIMDSATPEPARGDLPDRFQLAEYRDAVAARVRFRIGNIEQGKVGAPAQLQVIGTTLLIAVINHEYQHSQWISEVRSKDLGRDLPPAPESPRLSVVDGYTVIGVLGP
jgi:hypothetical protein